MEGHSLIETGVDKLVNLVRKNKKISIAQAAKQLGVSTVVVEEWADFLEEEGIISVEYKFTTPYLVEKRLTKEEIIRKEKEFGGKREAFVRRAEATLSLIDKESTAFEGVRKQFDELKEGLAAEIKHVKGDLKELEKYEELKNKIDIRIAEQQKEFKEKIEQIDRRISREEKKYADIIQEIDGEEKKLDNERMAVLSIREKENLLRQRLDNFRKLIEKLENSIEAEDKLVVGSEEHIARLKELADEVKESVEQRKAALEELFAESKRQENKIIEMQESILEKAKEKKKEIEERISEGKGASKKFSDFFEKKAKIEEMIARISDERDALEKELTQLVRKAKAFSIAAKSKDVAMHMAGLKGTFKRVEKKKGLFEKELRKLINLLRS